MAMVRADLMITKDEREALRKLGHQRGISVASVIRTILDRALGIVAPKTDPIKFADTPGSEAIVNAASLKPAHRAAKSA